MRRVTVFVGVLCAGIARPLAAQSSTADTSFAVARNGVIDITVRTGRLVVRGDDVASAELRAGGANYQLRSSGVGVTLAVDNAAARRGTVRTNAYARARGADIVLIVPRSTRVVVNGTSADVDVSEIDGDLEVTLVSGDLALRRLGGRAIIETMTGDVRITDGVGDLRVTTVNGDIVARGVRGTIDVNTTSGDVTLAAERFSRVEVTGVSGDVTLDGALADAARLQVSTHSGDVALRLPASAAGQLEVSTYNGSVLGGTMTLMPSGDRDASGDRLPRNALRYAFGSGGSARITVSTFSGDVTVQRGPRGGNE